MKKRKEQKKNLKIMTENFQDLKNIHLHIHEVQQNSNSISTE